PAAVESVEFCLSGPNSNARTGAHLRRHLPALEILSSPAGSPKMTYVVDGRAHERRPGVEEFVLVARVCRTNRPHLFLISGQTSVTNLAGAAFLARNQPLLWRRRGHRESFRRLPKVIEPALHGRP